MRLIDFFDRGVALAQDGVCFTDGSETLSYRAVQDASHRIAHGLAAAGVQPGTVVATLTPNHLRALIPVLGIARAGAVWLPLNARYGREEILHALKTNDCDFVFYHSDFEVQVQEARASLSRIRGSVCIDRALATAPELFAWMAAFPDTPVDVEQTLDTVIAIRSTGGTTGPSKGVMVSNENYETLFSCLFASLPPIPRGVHLAAAPLSHAAGTLSLANMLHGGRTVILPKFEADAVLACIERHGVTHLFVTPTMLYMLLDSPRLREFDYSSLRYVIYSGAPMSVEKLKQAIGVFGPVFAQAYGQAEAPFFCTCLTPAEHVFDDPQFERRLWSAGRATPFVRVEIMDESGKLLSSGERGEIVVRGNLVMKGYYNNPEATKKVSQAGWHRTGDIGYKDEHGYLYIVDRARDLIISGGFNLFPGEIEQVIWAHPAVQDCAVVGVPDERWGEAVKAIVQLRAGMTAEEGEIIALCREKLGRMKAPKSVEFWPDLPRSSVGKVLKREIRDRFWAGRERAV
jgi:acyl-CoA synthetase (AMP-forming)/AMP-acid ligase II